MTFWRPSNPLRGNETNKLSILGYIWNNMHRNAVGMTTQGAIVALKRDRVWRSFL